MMGTERCLQPPIMHLSFAERLSCTVDLRACMVLCSNSCGVQENSLNSLKSEEKIKNNRAVYSDVIAESLALQR